MGQYKQGDMIKSLGAILVMVTFAMCHVSTAAAARIEDLWDMKGDHLRALKKTETEISTAPKTGKKFKKESLRRAEALGLGIDDELKEIRTRKDRKGNTHTHYKQYFKGVPVWGSETVMHLTGGQPYELNGKIIKGLAQEIKSTVPKIGSAEAMATLKTRHEQSRNIQDQLAYANEKSELTIFVDNKDAAHLAYYISFFVDTAAGGMPSRPYFIIDAETGEILKQWEGLTHQKVGTGPGGNTKTGQYEYGATEDTFLDVGVSADAQRCVMENQNVRTIDMNHFSLLQSDPVPSYTYLCYRNMKEAINGAFSPLNDAHYFSGIVTDLYQTWYGTYPLVIQTDPPQTDPLQLQLVTRVHFGNSYENAFWNGSSITFGDGGTRFYPFTSLDIVAHEIGHGFTEQNSGLVYMYEHGAINEAFSDMAGEAAEFYARGTNDFEVGAEVFKQENQALRYMYDPPKDGVSIDNAHDQENEFLDVHYSSGVFNKAFYLLATTPGWNTQKAFDVFVKANQDYWTPLSSFTAAAIGVVQAAEDLDYRMQDVASAFQQVGVRPFYKLLTIEFPTDIYSGYFDGVFYSFYGGHEYTEGHVPVQGSVNLPYAVATDTTINLASSNPGQATISPQTIVIPAGETSAEFTLTIVDDTLLDGSQQFKLSMTASTAEFVLDSRTFTVSDNETAVLSVTLPPTATEGDGLLAGLGLVSVSSPVDTDVQVLLTATESMIRPPLLSVQPKVIIPAGSQQANFDLTTLSDGFVFTFGPGYRNRPVTATVQGWTAGIGYIYVNEDMDLHVSIPKQAVEWEGRLIQRGKVSLSGGTPVDNDVTITLTSDNTQKVTVPSSITIPKGTISGQLSKTFDIVIIDDGLEGNSQPVTIRAASPGFIDGAATIDIINERPDLEVTSISTLATGDTPSIDVNVTIATTGTTNAFYISYYLSAYDPITTTTTNINIGSRSVPFLNGAQSLSFSDTLNMPQNLDPAKTYRIGSTVDSGNSVHETDETNNALVGDIIAVSGVDLEIISVAGLGNGNNSTIPVSAEVKISGSTAGYAEFTFLLSENGNILTFDTWLENEQRTPVEGSQTLSITGSMHMPHNLDPAKTYRIGIAADLNDRIPESDETNNVKVGNIIAVSGPDMEITSLSYELISGPAPTILLSATIRNNGSNADFSELHYFLSEDATITTADLDLGKDFIFYLHGGENENVTESLPLPPNVDPTKTYWVGAIADVNNLVLESNETNNAKAGNIVLDLAGQHQIHAADYAFPCSTCHFGTEGEGLRIGFNWSKFLGWLTTYNGRANVAYEGTNHTKITNNGTMTCDNVYCHSNGKALRLNCATSTTNTSPKWDGTSTDPQGDTVKCNNCHGFDIQEANPMTSGEHSSHVETLGLSCVNCHADTVSIDETGKVVVSNKTYHVNGAYDVKGGGTFDGNPVEINYDKTTHTCSTTTCHASHVWASNDAETCPDPCAEPGAMENIDPVVSWTVENIDYNTLKIIDTSFDADRVDPVKNFCQGGGFNGAPGYLKVQNPDSLMGNYVAIANFQGTAMPSNPVVRTYRASAVDNITDPNVPRLWFNYIAIDNGPQSWNNSSAGQTVDGDGFNYSGWTAHILTPVDLSKVNIQPILDFTVNPPVRTGPNTCTLTITDNTIDTDYNDSAKNTLFGGGHNGSAGRGRLMFNTSVAGVDTGAVPINFTNVPSSKQISTTVYGGPNTTIWYQYFVFDNHYVEIPGDRESKSFKIHSGWKWITLP